MRQLLVLALLLASTVSGATIIRVDIDRLVHPVTVEMVSSVLEQAKTAKADLVLIRLNTPGGLMEATRELVEKIGASPVPVITFVAPGGARAASAGFFILLAGDVAVMAPGTRTGAASPVILGREMDPVMRRKIESDFGAALRTLAERHGRDANLAQQAVSEARSFTENEALAAKLVDFIAHDEADLFRQLDSRRIERPDGAIHTLRLTNVTVIPYQPTWRQKLFMAISDPNIAFILLILGFLGLYVEFSSPGLIVPGVLGSIMAPLALAALSLLPIDWMGAMLIVVALALFVLEAKFASHGILGVGGAVAMVLGATMLVDAPPEFRISLATALGVALPFAAIAVFLTTLVLRVHRNPVETGESRMVGEIGTALTALDPAGKIFVHGEYWDATSAASVPPNAKVRVLAVDGLRLRVEAVK